MAVSLQQVLHDCQQFHTQIGCGDSDDFGSCPAQRGKVRPHEGPLGYGQMNRLSGDRQLHQGGEDLLALGILFIAFPRRSRQLTRIMPKWLGIGRHEHPDGPTGLILNGKLSLNQCLDVAIQRAPFRPGSAFQTPAA